MFHLFQPFGLTADSAACALPGTPVAFICYFPGREPPRFGSKFGALNEFEFATSRWGGLGEMRILIGISYKYAAP